MNALLFWKRKPPACRVEQCPAPNVRVYHVREALTDQGCEYASHTQFEGEPNPWGAVADTLLRMRGVTGVWVNRYSVTVKKAEAFDWTEVEPAIIEFLAAFKTEVPA